MAAEALKRAATTMGHEIKVETQGSVGTRERLTEADIAAADVVVLAADIHVNETPLCRQTDPHRQHRRGDSEQQSSDRSRARSPPA